jgi:hypothetical protein
MGPDRPLSLRSRDPGPLRHTLRSLFAVLAAALAFACAGAGSGAGSGAGEARGVATRSGARASLPRADPAAGRRTAGARPVPPRGLAAAPAGAGHPAFRRPFGRRTHRRPAGGRRAQRRRSSPGTGAAHGRVSRRHPVVALQRRTSPRSRIARARRHIRRHPHATHGRHVLAAPARSGAAARACPRTCTSTTGVFPCSHTRSHSRRAVRASTAPP